MQIYNINTQTGIPEKYDQKDCEISLSYSKHSVMQSNLKNINLPPKISISKKNIIEVYINTIGSIEKRLIRVSYTERKDLCLIVKPNGLVITVWLNNKHDTHKSLKIEKYN